MNDSLIKPILKWVGGKRQLIDSLEVLMPKQYNTYCEPFLGGGAFFFYLQPKKAIINDMNTELITVYTVVRDDVEQLIDELSKYTNDRECFYRIRALDRNQIEYNKLSSVERAARFIYLNKTCFNGMYRVNSKGEFNVPYGNNKRASIVNTSVLRSVSHYLRSNEIEICNGDYEESLKNLKSGDFVYFDPPYDPVSETAAFTSYTKNGFARKDQIRLKEVCDNLTEKGIKFMLSNSATPFICELYKKYNTSIVHANRSINSKASLRGEVDEIVVRNY